MKENTPTPETVKTPPPLTPKDSLSVEVELSSATVAAYRHVESVKPDYPESMTWHGWALREAFIAGAKWQAALADGKEGGR